MRKAMLLCCGVIACSAAAVLAAPKYVWESAQTAAGLHYQIDAGDLINGKTPLRNTELSAGYPFNTNGYVPVNNMPDTSLCAPSPLNSPNAGHSGFQPATINQQGVGLTDGIEGLNPQNLDSVLADFLYPSAVFQFDLTTATNIGEIRVFAKNTDGRAFQNYDVFISTDPNPDTKERVFVPLISEVISVNYVCTGPGTGDGYAPNVFSPGFTYTLTRVFDDANPVLAAGATSVRFVFYPVDNTQGVFWDRWLGPRGCGDSACRNSDLQDLDGFRRPFVGTVVKEIDVLAVRGTFEICDNGQDDDADGAIDGADSDCFGRSCPKELCFNGIDDTGDGCVDCDDPDCRNEFDCLGPEDCTNQIDDNGNNLIDCDDPKCVDAPACQPCNAPVFDSDGDHDVDQADFAAFQACFTGATPGIPVIPGLLCGCFDRTGDDRIDENDLARFSLCASGPAIMADETCDD